MDQDDPTPDDFDTPWKTALTRYLPSADARTENCG